MTEIYENLVGKRYGKLTVVSYEKGKGCKCICDCGKTYFSFPCYLIKGRIHSCGCEQYEHLKLIKHPKKKPIFHPEILNKKYGLLTVLESVGIINGHEHFKCLCECGKEKIVDYYRLINGKTSSCGSSLHRRKVDITGQRFGRLVAIRPVYIKGSNDAMWEFKCDCGNIKLISAHSVLVTGTKSCGCLKAERNKRKESKTRLHRIWANMKGRCHNKKLKVYKHYGGRGIKVCEEWNEYKNFKEWALNNGYKDNLTIERIDVNGNYCPENCKWITLSEQCLNKRQTLLYLYKGKVVTLVELAKITNLSYDNIHHHYHRNDLEKWLRDRGF